MNVLMFHHFHGGVHRKSLGSIDSLCLEKMILDIGFEKFIKPSDFLKGEFDKSSWLVTLDDGLKSQYDVAKPVFDGLGIKAFWFIYTLPVFKGEDNLEVVRYFINNGFLSYHEFYDEFFLFLSSTGIFDKAFFDSPSEEVSSYLSEYSFYTREDRVYRYVRDVALDSNSFRELMNRFMVSKGWDRQGLCEKLFMSKENVSQLNREGHEIGLHSHTHPTKINALSFHDQYAEYLINKEYLEMLVDGDIKSVAYPCGSYNSDSKRVMRKLGIKVGFKSNPFEGGGVSVLEIPRIDHMEYLRENYEDNSFYK